jgi:asparagine synthase (glutamine-hydrolysing)
MRVTAQKIEVEQYFDCNRIEQSVTGDVRSLVTNAVRRQLVSDVPLGCFLSGGIDSSIIAAAMKTSVPADQPVLTFAIGFDDPEYDETRHAAEVARYLGTTHQQFIVRPDAASDLPKLASVFGEPFADSSALPTHYLARETRQHVKVALSGDGGDELFGGYDRYRATWMANAFQALPAALRKVASEKIIELAPGGKNPKSAMAKVKRMLATMNLPAPQRYDSYMRFFHEEQVAELLPRDKESAVASWMMQRYTALSSGRDMVQAAMALDRETYLPEDLLTKVDRASMLHALEVRSPFMDPALVRFAAQLTTEQMFGVGSTAKAFMLNPMNTPAKAMLRQAFARDLPASVFKRPKMGFAVPIGKWFREELRGLLTDSLTADDSFAMTHLNGDAVHRLLDDHQQKRADHAQRLYALLMLELWRKSQHAD